jgi:hypothetical protein
MLRRSATFRSQCWRITTAANLVVTLQSGMRPAPSGVRARTRMSRAGRQLVATVEISTPEQPEELIAHELEHIIEQLDGVDLAAKADADKTGVKRGASEQTFETVRATRVGRAVAAEVRRRTD